MSYDLHLLDPEPGVDPMDTLERLALEDARDPEAPARNRRIADALRAGDPRLEESAFGQGLELTDESGAAISLYDRQASISFPYWDSLDPATLIDQIEAAANAIAAETGWRLYDPQLEQFLDPRADADAFRETFDVGRGKVRRLTDDRPAWKRLFGRR